MDRIVCNSRILNMRPIPELPLLNRKQVNNESYNQYEVGY